MVAQLSAFHAVKQICLLLNVNPRGYQSWRNRTPSQRQLSNDILPFDMLPVSLTTVHLPFETIARAALQLLAGQVAVRESVRLVEG